jgi:uncharacterized protein YuzB (UPF0349 family)
MIKKLSLYDFRDEWQHSSRKNSFSYEGLELLYDYLEELEPDYDLDIVELDSAYSESTPEDIATYWDIESAEGLEDEELSDAVISFLEDNGAFIGQTDKGTIVYKEF